MDKHNPYPTVWINGQLEYVHRRVAVKSRGGIPLDKNECVHHKDENKLNNSPDNLMIMRSNSDHIALHHGNKPVFDEVRQHWFCPERKPPPLRRYSNKSGYEWQYRESEWYMRGTCMECGDSATDLVCLKCHRQHIAEHIPHPHALEHLIFKHKGNFTALGKLFGISDNGVRKWCKKYGLSYKSRNYKHGLVA